MKTIKCAGVMMALFVLLGAFGAHVLRERLSDEMMRVYQTGAFYHAVHGLGLFAVAWLETVRSHRRLVLARRLMITGTVVFSGSLYALAVTGLRPLGMITPFGGIALIASWLLVAAAAPRDDFSADQLGV